MKKKPLQWRHIPSAAPSLDTPAPPRDKARDVLNDLATFCLAHDPRELAAPVEDIKGTREKLEMLTRWFARYAASLPPGVQ
jgi:hypothetical protein